MFCQLMFLFIKAQISCQTMRSKTVSQKSNKIAFLLGESRHVLTNMLTNVFYFR